MTTGSQAGSTSSITLELPVIAAVLCRRFWQSR